MQTVYIGNTLINDIMLGSQRMDDVVQVKPAFQAEYLVVASGNDGAFGGGATNWGGGGGGAGGLLSGSLTILANTIYYIQAGGRTGISGPYIAYPSYITGSNFYHFANGGGYGGRGGGNDTTKNGLSGGSGGGGATNQNGIGTGGTGTSGQGNNGANSSGVTAGGGGGAGSAASGRTGGSGRTSAISGTSVTYAVGGQGGINTSGGSRQTTNGSGGGGGAGNGTVGPTDGTSGIVILRYLGPQKFVGGVVTTDGDYTIHTFDTSTDFTQYTFTY